MYMPTFQRDVSAEAEGGMSAKCTMKELCTDKFQCEAGAVAAARGDVYTS